MVENVQSLLLALAGKHKQKRDKVFQCYQSIEFNRDTKEYQVRSSTSSEKIYTVIYQQAKQQWFCNCVASVYFQYHQFDKLEDRKKNYKKKRCIHILACRLYNILHEIKDHV